MSVGAAYATGAQHLVWLYPLVMAFGTEASPITRVERKSLTMSYVTGTS